MDVTPYLEPRIAPRAVFDTLADRRDAPRFMVPELDGSLRAVTWGAFADAIRKVAAFLAEIGIAPGDRAAIFAANRVEWMSAALGIQAAGGVMVPIYPSSTAEQAGYVAAHSDSRVIFVDGAALLARLVDAPSLAASHVVTLSDALGATGAADELRRRGIEVLTWTQAQAVGDRGDARDPRAFERRMDGVSLDQPGMMLYTSGTSGNPKGVPLTHKNVAVNGADWLRCNAELLQRDMVDLLWLPMSHIFGFGEACLGNALGFTTTLADPRTVIERLPEVRPSVFMSVPSVWEKLAGMASGDDGPESRGSKEWRIARLKAVTGGRLRFCLSGGAGLKREVKERFYEAGLLIIEGYGLTECSPTLTMNRPDAFRFDSVGKPFPSVELRLDTDGEILARGPSVFAGYHKDPEATAAAFTEDGWFRTGDVGRFTDDGFLQIVDRKKDILVTAGGKNVPPANIEILFADDPLIAHVVVYGDGKKYLVAGVWPNAAAVEALFAERGVPREEREGALRALLEPRVAAVNARLAHHETIKRFGVMRRPLTVEEGFLTPTFKVRRKKVVEAFARELEALYEP